MRTIKKLLSALIASCVLSSAAFDITASATVTVESGWLDTMETTYIMDEPADSQLLDKNMSGTYEVTQDAIYYYIRGISGKAFAKVRRNVEAFDKTLGIVLGFDKGMLMCYDEGGYLSVGKTNTTRAFYGLYFEQDGSNYIITLRIKRNTPYESALLENLEKSQTA